MAEGHRVPGGGPRRPLMPRGRSVAVLWLAAAMAVLASGPASPADAAPSARQEADGVLFTFSADRPSSRPGPPVRFTLTMRNISAQPVTMAFPTSQLYDVLVTQDGRLVWRWSAGRLFLQALTRLTLAPAESRTYEVAWDRRDASGRPAPPGRYTAEARFPLMGRPQVVLRIPLQLAGAVPSVTARADGAFGAVLVNGVVVLRLREPAAGLSPLRRAEIVAARLRGILHEGFGPDELHAGSLAGEAAVLWRDRLVVTADARHAQLNRSTPAGLARLWRDRLVRALTS